MSAPLDRRDDPAAFRAEVRAWLTEVTPAGWRDTMRGASRDAYLAFQRGWLGEMSRVGLAAPHWPSAWGGSDLPIALQVIVNEELAAADAPDPELFTINHYHLPATLFAFGTAEQQQRYLAPAQRGAEIWCQGFSEPGAGSDLASLRTRAERHGDRYVVSGQKIWSSFAPLADFCLLLVRTDPIAPKKQAGISYLILDMHSHGVTTRPIRQITGHAEFAEIFLDEVEVPVANLIGTENDGWRIAQATLSAERGLINFTLAERMAGSIARELPAGRETWLRDDQFRREFAALYGEFNGVRALIRRLIAELEADPAHGGATTATYVKLRWAELIQDYADFLLRATGAAGIEIAPPTQGGGYFTGARPNDFLQSYGWTIAGGTNEIMRNVIAERFLHLPRG